jgi:dienelactone hydrolase
LKPLALRLLGSAAATVDRAFVGAMHFTTRKARARAERVNHADRLAFLAHVQRTYGAPELIAHPEGFFPRPAPVVPVSRFVRELAWGGECHELSWPSAYEPFEPRIGERYMAHVPNRTAWARVYGRGGRPAVIAVHGYLGGHWGLEERNWPIRSMNRWGLDVATAVLPFHAVRARPGDGAPPFPGDDLLRSRPGDGAPPFPGGDPRVANEAFRQIVADLRSLVRILRHRGAPSVGITGMSLGGYSTALMATVEAELAFAAPLIPLASVADYARDEGRLGAGDQVPLQYAALEAANLVASPLARPSLLPKERILVVGGEDDRVTPIAHAERLAAHFGVPLLRVHGGHLLQTWRATGFRALHKLLRDGGVV